MLREVRDLLGAGETVGILVIALFGVLASIVWALLDARIGSDGGFGIVGAVTSLALLLPNIAVATRRLHDTGRSGWWQLPVLLFFYSRSGEPAANGWGSDPKATV